eukprot:1367519-Heterocapsa_arctica.AAC.1
MRLLLAGNVPAVPRQHPEDPSPAPAQEGSIDRPRVKAQARPPKRKLVTQDLVGILGDEHDTGGQALRRLFARKEPAVPNLTQEDFPMLPPAGKANGRAAP